ncbi:superoxide dismutase [Faecalispora anaeroviscerum]|uniref:superoxide dismutase n=1 Tax=Faecalispora anaeroviscerum TaxID=2991836 RepID=UPI0024BB7B6A|nr:superoxide dismutase [Faecalispora anaeroviscerum]
MFEQVKLSYDFNALEPTIDELTMVTHYTKHHATYTKNLNAAIERLPELSEESMEQILAHLETIQDPALQTAVRNNGGGYYNHNLYFDTLSPSGPRTPGGKLAAAIDRTFGSFEVMKEKLAAAAVGQFGSGWAWLSANSSGDVMISASANQNNPIMETRGEWRPIFGIDVWEHAYYLTYKNLRTDYVEALFRVVDWAKVEKYYHQMID